MLNVLDSVMYGYLDSMHRVELADLYEDQIHTMLEYMVKAGKITAAGADELDDLITDLVGETDRQVFVDGIKYGVQFMTFAMQGIETNDEVSKIKMDHLVRNRKRYGGKG